MLWLRILGRKSREHRMQVTETLMAWFMSMIRWKYIRWKGVSQGVADIKYKMREHQLRRSGHVMRQMWSGVSRGKELNVGRAGIDPS